MNTPSLLEFSKVMLQEWQAKKAPQLAAALAYYSMFSLAPLAVLAVIIAGLALGRQTAQQQFLSVVRETIGSQGAQAVGSVLNNLAPDRMPILGPWLSAIMLFVGASFIFTQLKDALNTLWDVHEKPAPRLMKTVRDRLVGVAAVVVAAILLLVSLLLDVALGSLGHNLAKTLPWDPLIFRMLNDLGLFLMVVVGAALAYKYLPDAEVPWRVVWPGALVVGLLMALLKEGFSTYVQRNTLTNAYGAASSLAALLVFIYFSSIAFFIGATFVGVYARLASRAKSA